MHDSLFLSPQLLEKLIVRKANCFQEIVIFLQGGVWKRMETLARATAAEQNSVFGD